MLNFRSCWDTYDALDEALALEMEESLKHGNFDRHRKLNMKRLRFIRERLALFKEYEAEREAKAEAARKRTRAKKSRDANL